MVYTLNTKMTPDEASQAFYQQQAIQRSINANKFVLDKSVFEKNLADRFDLKRAKAKYKNQLRGWFGKDWSEKKGPMNLPAEAYSGKK